MLSDPFPPDPIAVDAIARAERRRGLLEGLSDIGMEFAQEIASLRGAELLDTKSGRNPARMFAAVSRSIRLTVAFEARIDEDVLAMRKGEVRPWQAARGALSLDVFPSTPTADERDEDACEAIDLEVDGPDEERGESRERLIEYESFNRYGALSWPACLAAIHADLGEPTPPNPASPEKAGSEDSALVQPGQVAPRSKLPHERPDRLDPRLRGASGSKSDANPDLARIERENPNVDTPPARQTGAPRTVRNDRRE